MHNKTFSLKFVLGIFLLTLISFCLATTSAFADSELHIVSATASTFVTGYPASKTIDNNLTTYWKGKGYQSFWWLKYDLGAQATVSQISIWWHNQSGSSNYKIQVSLDGINWITRLSNLNSGTGSTNPIKVTHTLSPAANCRYVRIYIVTAKTTAPIVYEVKIYGTPPDVPPKITSIAPADGTIVYAGDTVVITPTVQDSDPSPLEYQFSVDGAVVQSWSAKSTYNWPASLKKHTIKVQVRDAGGQDSKEVELFGCRRPIPPP